MNMGWYFTAPLDPVMVRRGDALGFRIIADYFADLLAPGLSNGTSDVRWVSILSWCLVWSDLAWRKAGGGDLSQRDYQKQRYAWLRPLELLWVARALEAGQETGQLRGRRSVERWRNQQYMPPNFALSADQFRRFRQTGSYGAYRVIFRTTPGLTTGDGWTPGETAIKLAAIVDERLPNAARPNEQQFRERIHWKNWSSGNQVRFWIERGWQGWKEEADVIPNSFPTRNEDNRRKLKCTRERDLLKNAIFDRNSIRRTTASVLADAESAKTHAELCDALASSHELSKQLGGEVLAPLPAFTRFADAAMEAMRGAWDAITDDKTTPTPPLQTVASLAGNREKLDRMRGTCEALRDSPGLETIRHKSVVSSILSLATDILDARSPEEQLRVLAIYHQKRGGGRRWFREEDGRLEPLVRPNDVAATDYRFRLQPLARLAAQCGVANLNPALDALEPEEHDEEDETL